MILTISGLHGTGKSTVAKNIAVSLGLKFYSTGDAFRELGKDMNMTLEEFTQYVEKIPEIDLKLDDKILTIAKQGNVIIDSQLGGFLLESIADFKILLTCSLETRVKRMAERDQTSYEESLKETSLREKSELERFKKLYNIDISDQLKIKKTFNLIIDTENLSIQEVIDKILNSLE